MPRPIQALIDSAALTHNLQQVHAHLRHATRDAARQTRTWAVIKANAYGHGIEVAVAAFAAANGLAMLDFDEAQRARAAGWQGPILMLEGFFDAQDLKTSAALDLWPVVHEPGQLAMLEAFLRTQTSR